MMESGMTRCVTIEVIPDPVFSLISRERPAGVI
jgi:hypothetical protein